MKNPWKRLSKVNPQRENGNRQISSEVFEALIKASLSGGEYKIALAIIHKTWGFQKTSDTISTLQLEQMTGLADRTVKLTIKQLKEKRIICYEQSKVRVHHGSPMNEFMFNKHYDTWLSQGCKKLHACKDMSGKGAKSCRVRVHYSSPTKERITKETISKEKTNTLVPSSGTQENLLPEPSQVENERPVSKPMTAQEVETPPGTPGTEKQSGAPSSGVEGKERQAKKCSEEKTKNPDIWKFINFSCQTYKAKFKTPLVITKGRDGAIIKKLLEEDGFSLEELKKLWVKFINSQDKFVLESGIKIPVFHESINTLVSGGRKPHKDPCHHDEGRPPSPSPEQQSEEQKRRKLIYEHEIYLQAETKRLYESLEPEEHEQAIKKLEHNLNRISKEVLK